MDQHSPRKKTFPQSTTVQQKAGPPKAPPVYRPQPVPKVLQTKMATIPPTPKAIKPPQAPPVYRPQQPRIQAKFTAATKKTSIPHKGVIQRHPMIISIEGRNGINTDTNNFGSIEDVTQYLPPGASSSAVRTVCIRKESRADHQYVIATTACGITAIIRRALYKRSVFIRLIRGCIIQTQ